MRYFLHLVKVFKLFIFVYLSQTKLYFCSADFEANCTLLQIGQYICNQAEIDTLHQQPKGCTVENVALVNCTTSDGIICKNGTGLDEKTFEKWIPCQFTNGYSFETTLLLSVFLGMFGLDRFYLGYPAIGLAKFCTLGFMFLGQLIDIILIALQIVGPSDGSSYVISYFGPGINFVRKNNDTYVVPP